MGNDGSSFFSVRIDELRLWSVVRSDDQLARARHRPVPSPSANLVGYWRFDEGSGTIANDLSRVDHPGFLNGGAQWFPPRTRGVTPSQ